MEKTVYLNVRKELNLTKRTSQIIRHMIEDIFILGLVVFGVQFFEESWTFVLFAPFVSLFMFRSFSWMHDAVHSAVTDHRFVNDLIGIVYGAFCLLPFSQWKEVHLEHHVWSGNADRDPVMGLVRHFEKWNPNFKLFCTGLWKFWLPILAAMQYFIFWFHCSRILLQKSISIKKLISFILPVLSIVGVYVLCSKSVFWIVVVPGIVFYLLAVEIVNFPHHLGLEYLRESERLPVWKQDVTARTCLYPKFFSRFCVLNFNYHVEHHMFPDAPWYYLDRIHFQLRQHLDRPQNLDHQFEWILENRPRSLDIILKFQ